MEVATTTNNHHNHSHHHKHHQSSIASTPATTTNKSTSSSKSNNNNNHHPHQHASVGGLLVANTSNTNNNTVATSGARSPFQREVREWQRIDPDTGALLSGRLEADRWVAGPQNSYGKISDSQNITQPNGTQHTQRKQLEVLQARTANGAMQVIRAQTIQTTSSRWSAAAAATTTSPSTLSTSPHTPTHNHAAVTQPPSSALLLLSPSSSSSSLSSSASSSLSSSLSMTNDVRRITNSKHHQNHHHNHHNHHHNNSLFNKLHQFKTAAFGHAHLGNNNDNDDDDDNDDNDIDNVNDHQQSSTTYLINGVANRRLYNNNTHNGQNSHSPSKSNGTGIVSNLPLLDTEPSLKLSNLMKSSSSISSGSNNSITTTSTPSTAATMSTSNNNKGTHKISLQSIVGTTANNNQNNEASTSRHQRSSRVFEQPAIYGHNNGWAKSRVGVNDTNEATGGGGDGDDDDDDSFTDELHRHRRTTPPTHSKRQHSQTHRVFESFRHGMEQPPANDDNGEGDDEDLRLTARHQRRQQLPQSLALPLTLLQRSRSISTDDLSTEWSNGNGDAIEEEPGEWRRVSKLRRSFQSAGTHDSSSYNTPRRPLDLPSNSVSVSRIRAELESGRLMNAAMRTHHVDLAALDKILNATEEDAKPVPAKRSTFLTAESLQEIRGKLKKLSDESLYKEDFMLSYQQPPPVVDEQIEVQHHMRKPSTVGAVDTSRSAFESVASRRERSLTIAQNQQQEQQSETTARTTNSLESRLKSRDSSSTEWHSRRKSYGFEKMSPPDDKLTLRMDASTDSGLGRSGELGNWSPTEAASAGVRGTVIHFGESAKALPTANSTPAVRRRYRPLKSPSDDNDEDILKRHSIAVDESQYVRENLRKTSQVHLNGFYESNGGGGDSSNSNGSNSSTSLFQRHQHKRVEFCKTEVHFAAESGRVNIVETDGKPPPTQNFRRRRRTTSGPLQSLVKPLASSTTTSSTTSSGVAVPVTLFGDHDKARKTITSTQVAYKAALVDALVQVDSNEPINVTVSMPKLTETFEGSRSSYASTSGIDTTDNETDELSAIRGILKNKPIKPKPYHLGENFETPDALWGVQLKPIPGAVTKRPNGSLNFPSGELVHVLEKRPESLANNNASTSLHNGYSTKINLSLGDSLKKDWPETGVHNLTTTPARRASAQELMLQDLREHQRILDQGLKSTSLIIKTMRSANEFDEAMRRLSIASLDASPHMPSVVVPTPMLRSNSYQETSRRASNTSCTSNETQSSLGRRYSTDSYTDQFKLFANGAIPVSQQLSQLRRMYDDDADSADEEVKSYFSRGLQDNSGDSGDGTQESSSLEDDMHAVEYSNSWSRLKAKRTIWRIETAETALKERTDIMPSTNVMNIELHSPMADTAKPLAKPRLLSVAQTKVQETSTAKQPHFASEPLKEPLKIIKEARGARKLKDHELSYFGVQVPSTIAEANELPKSKFPTTTTTPSRRTLPRAEKTKPLDRAGDSTKWPDLLRHSNARNTDDINASDEDDDEHFYENITNELTPTFKVKPPDESNLYNRKTDLKRDAQILSEMTQNADQTMKALTDESAFKDQRRRSLHRRNSKPLETISEKSNTEKINDHCIAVKVARSTMASEAKRTSRHSTPSPSARARSSSQSSVESRTCPRDRSRSLSSEREYENVKVRRGNATSSSSSTTAMTKTKSFNHRSSATHTPPTHGSSGDEAGKYTKDRPARPIRSKRSSSGNSNSSAAREKHSREHERERDRSKYRTSTQRPSGTTHSSQKERVECPTDGRHRTETTTHGSTSTRNSSRRSKEEHHDSLRSSRSASTATTRTRGEKLERSSGSGRLVRSSRVPPEHEEQQHHHQRATQQRSKESDKEKSARSNGLSSRSTVPSRDREQQGSAQHMSGMPTKIRDHRKTTHHSSSDTMTHSKNPQIFNGHEHHTSSHNHHTNHTQQPRNNDQQPLHHVHSLTTTTIAAKHRERNGKDRK